MQSVASEAVEFGVREAGRFLSSRDRPYRDSEYPGKASLITNQGRGQDIKKSPPLGRGRERVARLLTQVRLKWIAWVR